MCTAPSTRVEQNAEQLLAGELLKAVKSKVDGSGHVTYMDPVALRELILKRWDRISTLAHAIHDAKPKEKTTREKLGSGGSVYDMREGFAEVLDRLEALERANLPGGVRFYRP